MAEKESVLNREKDAAQEPLLHDKMGDDGLLAGFRIAALPGVGEIPSLGLAAVDNDLALENMEDHWDMTAADRQDWERRL